MKYNMIAGKPDEVENEKNVYFYCETGLNDVFICVSVDGFEQTIGEICNGSFTPIKTNCENIKTALSLGDDGVLEFHSAKDVSSDVTALVVAARRVLETGLMDGDYSNLGNELDAALEKFATSVPFDESDLDEGEIERGGEVSAHKPLIIGESGPYQHRGINVRIDPYGFSTMKLEVNKISKRFQEINNFLAHRNDLKIFLSGADWERLECATIDAGKLFKNIFENDDDKV